MNVSAIIEKLRGLLPDVIEALSFALTLPEPVPEVVDVYLQDHLGFWRLEVAEALDVGAVRERQEDGVFVSRVGRGFAVIDGMGGQGTGDWATSLAVEALEAAFPHPTRAGDVHAKAADCPMVAALEQGNAAIIEAFPQSPRGLGAAAAAVFVDGISMNVAHVGDCRVYRLRRGSLAPLTRDHSLVNEYREALVAAHGDDAEAVERAEAELSSHYANIITRSLGHGEPLDVEWSRHPVAGGDVVLLCTDGLWRAVSDEAMGSILGGVAGERASCAGAARALVDAALAAQAADNVGLVLVRFAGQASDA